MKTVNLLTALLVSLLLCQSCIVSGPKYTNVEKVIMLKPGMSIGEVNTHLNLQPYDIYCYDSIGNRSFVYKYRVTDRKTVPFLVKETNGVKSKGKYMDLITYYDSCDVAYRFESKPTDSKLDEKRVNINTLITAITVTAPSVLVYLGITKQ